MQPFFQLFVKVAGFIKKIILWISFGENDNIEMFVSMSKYPREL
jgi:hypothetical protein